MKKNRAVESVWSSHAPSYELCNGGKSIWKRFPVLLSTFCLLSCINCYLTELRSNLIDKDERYGREKIHPECMYDIGK